MIEAGNIFITAFLISLIPFGYLYEVIENKADRARWMEIVSGIAIIISCSLTCWGASLSGYNSFYGIGFWCTGALILLFFGGLIHVTFNDD